MGRELLIAVIPAAGRLILESSDHPAHGSAVSLAIPAIQFPRFLSFPRTLDPSFWLAAFAVVNFFLHFVIFHYDAQPPAVLYLASGNRCMDLTKHCKMGHATRTSTESGRNMASDVTQGHRDGRVSHG